MQEMSTGRATPSRCCRLPLLVCGGVRSRQSPAPLPQRRNADPLHTIASRIAASSPSLPFACSTRLFSGVLLSCLRGLASLPLFLPAADASRTRLAFLGCVLWHVGGCQRPDRPAVEWQGAALSCPVLGLRPRAADGFLKRAAAVCFLSGARRREEGRRNATTTTHRGSDTRQRGNATHSDLNGNNSAGPTTSAGCAHCESRMLWRCAVALRSTGFCCSFVCVARERPYQFSASFISIVASCGASVFTQRLPATAAASRTREH
jgi:hypothetical protein